MIIKLQFTLLFFILTTLSVFANPLQTTIDNAEYGAIITLEKGLYEAPIYINKSITLRGVGDSVYIRGNDNGSVIYINADNVVIDNLNILGSGESHESIDSCISVKSANNIKVTNNRLNKCLFGINFEKVNRSQIEGNAIRSKDFSLGLRGDGIRLWYSHSNVIVANTLDNVRDTVFWYSSGNHIEQNRVTNSRYSLHFMYADRNFIVNNYFENNSVGVFVMYSHGSKVVKNLIMNSSGAFGIGIGFKEVSDCIVEDNLIVYNARGLYLDQSPYQPDTVNKFYRNRVFFNNVAIQFHGTNYASVFEDNHFKGNLETIANDTPMSKISLNRWTANYWDEYEGFDNDEDNYGDTPYLYIEYSDKIFDYIPPTRFFYATPIISLLNFLSKLLPFSEPLILATDHKPLMKEMGMNDEKE